MARKIKYFLIFSFSLFVFFSLVPAAGAQVDAGINVVSNNIQLSATSPIEIAARIINVFLLILGILAVGLIIFAGAKWMTSGGNEEKISEARKVLKNAAIGLAIILASWGIVTFIFSYFFGINGGGSGIFGGGSRYGDGGGFGAIGSCTVQSVYPAPGTVDVARNTAIMITFKLPIQLASNSSSMCVNSGGATCACDNSACNLINPAVIKIYKNNDGDVAATNLKDVIITADSLTAPQTFVLKPKTYLGTDTGNTDYTVFLTNDIMGSDGKAIFNSCSTDYLKWGFQVSNILDLTPPQVASDGIFPPQDNVQDSTSSTSVLTGAHGSIQIQGAVRVYAPASISSVSLDPVSASWQSATAAINGYHGGTGIFTVTIAPNTKARLYEGNNPVGALLDEQDVSGGQIDFPGYFTLTIGGNHSWGVGNSWKMNVNGETAADTITISGDTYTFSTAPTSGYTIHAIAGPSQQAAEITMALSGRLDVVPSASSNTVLLNAVAQGAAGNSIGLSTNAAASRIVVTPMTGGQDAVSTVTVNGQPDQPMNSVIQINFNEAVNPMTVSGPASAVGNTIRVVNNNVASYAAGHACTRDDQCRSYKCNTTSSQCEGDYLDGKFTISNGYKTVGFTTNNECGINGCGGKIYCLPANSNLKVELVAADLIACTTNADCVDKSPYSTCAQSSTVNGQLGYKTCQDSNNLNYPGAPSTALSGVMDAAFNSLNGNRDNTADGPRVNGGSLVFYDEKYQDTNYKDSYRWSFWISDRIIATPPSITSISPASHASSVSLTAPIAINFNRLMKSDTLITGSVDITTGTSTVNHKLINLFPKASGGPAIGYWITSDVHVNTSTNEYSTAAKVNHSSLVESLDYKTQVGSGVNDIYQNCFKPSSGVGCNSSQDINTPSCCDGAATGAANCP